MQPLKAFVVKERFFVFQKTFDSFFKERFYAVFRETIYTLQKRISVFWETHFIRLGHGIKDKSHIDCSLHTLENIFLKVS